MKIQFDLAWLKPGTPAQRAFKSQEAYALFSDYVKRISQFCSCGIAGTGKEKHPREAGARLWLCDRGRGSKVLSSEELARLLGLVCISGARQLEILIGGPDGFTPEEIECLKPDLKWSFGSLTLPHELAAIVAGEQIYRAWTILKNHPYHKGH